jgi:hypothetical protein
MDAETARLLVTAAAAVIAGLGGAGLTGWFNRKNTTASLEAARETNREQWRQTREREHEVWLRDHRLEACVAFFDEAERFHHRVALSPTEEVKYETAVPLQAHRARLVLIATVEIGERPWTIQLAIALGRSFVAWNKVYHTRAAFTGDNLEAEKRLRRKSLTIGNRN